MAKDRDKLPAPKTTRVLQESLKHAFGSAYFDTEQLIKDEIDLLPTKRNIGLESERKIPYRVQHYDAKHKVANRIKKAPASSFVAAFFGQPPRDIEEAEKGVGFTDFLKRFVGWPGSDAPLRQKIAMPFVFVWNLITFLPKVVWNTLKLVTEVLPDTLSRWAKGHYREVNKFPPLVFLTQFLAVVRNIGRAITSPIESVKRLWNDGNKAGAIASGVFSLIMYAIALPILLPIAAPVFAIKLASAVPALLSSAIGVLSGIIGSMITRLENKMSREAYIDKKAYVLDKKTRNTKAANNKQRVHFNEENLSTHAAASKALKEKRENSPAMDALDKIVEDLEEEPGFRTRHKEPPTAEELALAKLNQTQTTFKRNPKFSGEDDKKPESDDKPDNSPKKD
jgi:hypothetical protein